ncbi:MAG: FAD binding domain-containing protein [Deltaproteobacteria bacterium]|nr:FAD binding domain-containing protein [Deltaproteobacteria bacterium]
MRLPKFDYFEPKDINEAVSILQNEPAARILAGGTDLLMNMKHRVECPPVVVNIKRLADLNYIRQDNGDIRIGALTPLKEIYMTAPVKDNLPGLAQAASAVGSYHHQVMGTFGGNICQQNRCKFFNQSQWWRRSRPTCFKAGGEICHVVNKKEICYSTYCGDLAPALLALNAAIRVAGNGGEREISLKELFTGNGKAPLNLDGAEILTEIVIPRVSTKGVLIYMKFANRASIDFPIVGTAFWASTDQNKYRVAFTAVDRKPLRALNIEACLKDKELNDENITEACDLAAKEAKPVKTSVYSATHKRKMMGLLLRSAAEKAQSRLSRK